MIIIKFKGGLGNQMFQYAMYLKFMNLGKVVYADKLLFDFNKEKRKFGLDVFNFKLNEATEEACISLRGEELKISDILRRKYSLIKTYYREKEVKYNSEITKMDKVYLDGYWQSERYFEDIKRQIKAAFVFPEIVDEKIRNYAKKISEENSISVHVRRGDYLKYKDIYGGICTEEYYKNAIAFINKKIENPRYYIFSDDIDWAKEHFAGEEYIYVENQNKGEDYIDMHLMSLCKHNIIANSSFSWWGAWLNEKSEKIVIAPKRWLRKKEVQDVWCEGWLIF